MIQKFLKDFENLPSAYTPPTHFTARTFPEPEMPGFPDGLHPLYFIDLYTHKLPTEPGAAYIWKSDQYLHVLAVMIDSSPHSSAAPVNDRCWEKGDTCELFLMPDDAKEDYYELHITPNQATLQLHIPSATAHVAGETVFEELFCETQLKADAYIFANGTFHGYWAHLRLPLSILGTSRTGAIRFALGRYNERPGITEPEISATASYPTPRFHQPAFWHTLTFES